MKDFQFFFLIITYFIYFSFECPDFDSLDSSKCYYKKNTYDLGHELSSDEVPKCLVGCKCGQRFGPIAKFECSEIACPRTSFLNSHYSHSECCPHLIRT